jgi:RNA polymerase sigma-70 factor (ECF subfamily)
VCGQKYGNYCYSIAQNILGNRSDAEECVNETWFKAWNAIPPSKPTHFKAFLGKIVRNLALDYYEAAHTQKRGGGVALLPLEELGDIQAPSSDEGEITQVINAFLRDEPTEDADIFVKRYWYMQSVKDIAEEYGYSESKVKSRLLRMRKRLKKMLESECLM